MLKYPALKPSRPFIIYSFSGILIFLSILCLDRFVLHRTLISEEWPKFTFDYLARTFLLFISIFLLFKAVTRKENPVFGLSAIYGNKMPMISVSLTAITAVMVLGLFLFFPREFSNLSLEDNLVEWGSALFLFAGAGIFIDSALKRGDKYRKMLLLLFAATYFVVAMEEVSWFQRVFDLETPAFLETNRQHELNLHNLSTDYAEHLYYHGTFIFLAVVPFLFLLFRNMVRLPLIELFIASPFVILIASMPNAYNFDMWDVTFTQWFFFMSIFILIWLFKFSGGRLAAYSCLAYLVMIILSQVSFFAFGENFGRLWDVTEYKELFIASALLVYALDVSFKIRNERRMNHQKNKIKSAVY